MGWRDEVQRDKPFGPELIHRPQARVAPPQQRAMPFANVKTEDDQDDATDQDDECKCRNPMCPMKATFKCRRCGHQACDRHKAILESFKSPRDGKSAKHIHNFKPYNCEEGEFVNTRDALPW